MTDYAPGDLVQFRRGRQTMQGTIKAIGGTTAERRSPTQRDVTIELTWMDLGGKEHHTDVTVPFWALAGRYRVNTKEEP